MKIQRGYSEAVNQRWTYDKGKKKKKKKKERKDNNDLQNAKLKTKD